VSNFTGGTVTKIRASDSAVQGTFAVGTGPSGIAFDRANMWVVNQNSNNVIKLPVFP
jgi:DNA-binding beta-propeller fold protein YncE